MYTTLLASFTTLEKRVPIRTGKIQSHKGKSYPFFIYTFRKGITKINFTFQKVEI